MFPLRSINKRLVEIIEACYSGNGLVSGKASVYLPYSSKPDDCRSNEQVSRQVSRGPSLPPAFNLTLLRLL